MKTNYLFASLLLVNIATGGLFSSCSNNNEPEIPTPDEKIDSLDVTLQLLEKQKYIDSIAQGSRVSVQRPSTGGFIWFMGSGDRYSIYESGTANKLGTVICTDEFKGIYEGKIGVKDFEGSKKVYLALDQNASDNIRWNGKEFTFKNAYGTGTYKGWIGKGTDLFNISSPTGEGAQRYYQLGEGTFIFADKRITGYTQTAIPVPFITIPKDLLKSINQIVEDKGYTQLTLKVQTDENVLTSWTYNPANFTYTFSPSTTNIRLISYDAKARELTSGEDVRLYFTIEPGTWTNPTITLYGGTSENEEIEVLGTVKVPDKYKKLEFISADAYDSETAATYQKPSNFIPSYGTLVKE